MYQCEHPERQNLIKQFLIRFRKMLEANDTPFFVTNLLVTSIARWCNSPQSTIPEVHSSYLKAAQEQQSIGWDCFLQGYLSSQWQLHLPATAANRNRWTVTVIKFLWTEFLTIWKARNANKHGYDQRTRQITQLQIAEQKLRSLYSARNQVQPRLRRIFHKKVEDHLQQPLHRLQYWIATYEPIIKTSIRAHQTTSIQGVKPIHTYFEYFPP